MSNFPDILTLTGSIRTNIRRFPLPIAFSTLLCIVIILNIWNIYSVERLVNVSIYYLSIGFFLSLFIKLWTEEVRNKKVAICINTILHTLLLLDAVYLYVTTSTSWLEIILARTAVICLLLTLMFILPFFREKNDIASWNLTVISITNASLAILVSHLMFAGICLLLASLNALFGLTMNEKWYQTIWVLCCIGLSTILFLSLFPCVERKANRMPIVLGLFKKVVHFLFLPLLGIYMIVLYAYATKILIQWELPNGWVSILTTTLMIGYIAITFGLYPAALHEKNHLDQQIARWLPRLILPILILMSVGIIRRFNDYGITINRLYILTLNIWFYIVCIGSIINKNKRIHWIPISFSILFVLTSLFPVNFTSITRNTLLKEVQKEINTTYKGTLPMNDSSYTAWLETYPREKSIHIDDKIKYLDNTFGEECLSHLIKNVNYYQTEYQLKNETKYEATPFKVISESQHLSKNFTIDLSKGYSSITYYKSQDIELEEEQQSFTISLQPSQKENIEMSIQTSDIYEWGGIANKKWEPQDLPCSPSNYRFILTDFSYHTNHAKECIIFKYSGYLLKKQ